ncbi:Transcription factor E2F/dimerization partner (TDP) [Forsythia ovata]|uniref:Transcription factor E2F/dimerization partner (TDP) n=1 Tax=Forsythia ovata TaxID=205694 RepID=A0ABD1TTQ9_9LAMI
MEEDLMDDLNFVLIKMNKLEGSLRAPVSGKVAKAQKVPRTAKASKAESQTPVANIGSHSGNNLTPVGACRYDSSLAIDCSILPKLKLFLCDFSTSSVTEVIEEWM